MLPMIPTVFASCAGWFAAFPAQVPEARPMAVPAAASRAVSYHGGAGQPAEEGGANFDAPVSWYAPGTGAGWSWILPADGTQQPSADVRGGVCSIGDTVNANGG